MTKIDSDKYVNSVVAKHTPIITYSVAQKIQELVSHIHLWANGHQYTPKLSGSHAKGTAITGTTDIDIFISLDPSVKDYNTLENVYVTLRNRFSLAGYSVREQNVSIGIDHAGLKIDLVAGVKHHILGLDHSLWKRKTSTRTKTNIDSHINLIKNSGRVEDIKAVKI